MHTQWYDDSRDAPAGLGLPPRGTDYELPPMRRGWTDEEDRDFALADVSSQAIERMCRFNAAHNTEAWDLRRRDPITPYGLALLYLSPSANRANRWKLSAATRLWLRDPAIKGLPGLLYDYIGKLAAAADRAGPFDLRVEVADVADEVPDDAFFTGVAVSTLDTYQTHPESDGPPAGGPWREVLHTAAGPQDIPGRFVIVLRPKTVIVGDRRARAEFNELLLHTNHPLEIAPGHARYPRYQQPTLSQLLGEDDPATQTVTSVNDDHRTLRFLMQLSDLLWSIDNGWRARRGGQR